MKQTVRLCILLGLNALFFAALPAPAPAQQAVSFTAGETAIITLKSGEKFEGKVVSDAPDSVEIEYRLTPKIKDKKILLKAEITDVKKLRPSETEFAERALAKLLPTPDLKDASYYESTIQDNLRTFVAKYPGTPEAAEVEKMIATFADEKSRVVSGQVKVEGRWLDAATVKREAYNIAAYREYLRMQEKAAENKDTRYLDALRAFDKLRTDYPASPYFVKAVPEAQEYLKKFEVQVMDMIKEAPILAKRRQDGLKQLQANELPAAKKAVEDEKRAYEEVLRRQIAEKVKWRDLYKYEEKPDKGGLQYTLTTISKEKAELTALNLTQIQADGELVMTVIRALAEKNLADAGSAMEKASKIANPAFRPMIQSLSKQLVAARDAAKKEQKAGAAQATSGSGAPADGAAAGSNPVAEAMKKVQEEKAKKAAAAKAEAEAKAAAAAKAAAEAKDAAPVEPTLMEKLNDYLPLIGGGLVAVILLAWLMGRRKKNED